jgi:Ca2+-binding EF-hand superfamily protein
MIIQKTIQDSIASGRINNFMRDPSTSSLKKVDTEIQKKAKTPGSKPSKLPKEFEYADTNHDGIISSAEVTSILDRFFDGSTDFTMEKFNALIDYFFEQ